MSPTALLVWMIAMAIVTIVILVIGTLSAADLMSRRSALRRRAIRTAPRRSRDGRIGGLSTPLDRDARGLPMSGPLPDEQRHEVLKVAD